MRGEGHQMESTGLEYTGKIFMWKAFQYNQLKLLTCILLLVSPFLGPQLSINYSTVAQGAQRMALMPITWLVNYRHALLISSHITEKMHEILLFWRQMAVKTQNSDQSCPETSFIKLQQGFPNSGRNCLGQHNEVTQLELLSIPGICTALNLHSTM